MLLVSILVALGMSLSTCQNPENGVFYLAVASRSDSFDQCVNEWALTEHSRLVMSPAPLNVSVATQRLTDFATAPNHIYWLAKLNQHCTAAKVSPAQGIRMQLLGKEYALFYFNTDDVDIQEADISLHMCDRTDVSFSLANTQRAMRTGFNEPVTMIEDDMVKDAFVMSIGEPEGGYMRVLSELSGAVPNPYTGAPIPTRYTYTADNIRASEFIADYLVQYGAVDDVLNQDFAMPNGQVVSNVIGIKYGSELPDEIVVVGAHFDSISPQPTTNAPGAIDNGSGTVGMMVIAAALRNMNLKRTIHLVAFNGEEQGLYGSAHYVAEAQKRGDKIVCALTMDMTAYSNQFFGVIVEGTTNSAIQALMTNVAANTAQYAPELTVVTSNLSFGSDHVSFQRAGIPAILSIQQDDTNYPGYHQITDTVAYGNEAQAIGITRGLAGSLYDYAQA